MRWRLLLLVLVVVLLLLPAAPPAPAQDLATLEPDAALWAQTIDASSRGLEGLSWTVATVAGHRGWLDLLKPLDRLGIGLSADVRPGGPLCVGGGYQADAGWVGYVGVHASW